MSNCKNVSSATKVFVLPVTFPWHPQSRFHRTPSLLFLEACIPGPQWGDVFYILPASQIGLAGVVAFAAFPTDTLGAYAVGAPIPHTCPFVGPK